jgi:RNA polymerase sigma-70 factor, ECF subfamily
MEFGMRSAAPQSIATSTPGSDLPDAILVARAQHDRRAVEPLYHRYFDAVFRFCFYRLGDWQDAEDATGDIFAKVIANLERFREDGREDAFRCWLFTIARNVVSNRRRDQVRHPIASLDGADQLHDDAPTPEEAALAADDHSIVRALLARLSPSQRDLLELRLIGLNDKEIARVLDRSHDAVRKEQSRTIRALRDFLAQNPEWGGSHV